MAKSSHTASRIGHMVKVSNGGNWKPASQGTQSGAKAVVSGETKGC